MESNPMREIEPSLQAGERLDDLLTHNLKIIQSPEVFSFSLDAVLLARFAGVPPRGRILDLCTGNGVIPMLLATRTDAKIDGVEIQPRLADMARRSVALNGLSDKISIVEGDLREWKPDGELYDAVTVNPPYLPLQSGDYKENIHQAMARHEIGCKLEDVIAACAKSVRIGGRVAMVHRPSRMVDIIDLMRRYRLEPKRIRFVHPRKEAEANMILIEATRDGRPEARLLPPLIVYEEDGEYTPELLAVFYGQAAELPDFKRQNGRTPLSRSKNDGEGVGE
ncbi:tRNA1(Val) (adenine(37)-N6)-methyltransferase [Cohnella cholangitidis]|uniref:tRNA1(Val) (Adenine(37)-N6)-methyltransferase n=1 Tax=Cohnella cholangitidis TaxID=2598458 RepID=A0A7G5BZ27_9BACL|nr:tRNA1(Val) (adenine(37)-N6)-methyltransferase [Cohnella cholangitidis]QMV42211.1 tRNA1(Val) (adenine(37)-N6)-methyltransferase [Cohnella cholangitidis]